MGHLATFTDLAKCFQKQADFVCIYIEEAHPVDGWMYPAVEIKLRQHRSIAERIHAASILRPKLGDIPLFVDSMDNTASHAFGALPERLAIVLDGRVTFMGQRPGKLLGPRSRGCLVQPTSVTPSLHPHSMFNSALITAQGLTPLFAEYLALGPMARAHAEPPSTSP